MRVLCCYINTNNEVVLTCFEEVKEKSSHYGLNMLGYTCATKMKTVGRNYEIRSKSLKII
jgi:hypothetical protein